MRETFSAAAAAICAVWFLAGCSGAHLTDSLPWAASPRQTLAGTIGAGSPPDAPAAYQGVRDLYVVDGGEVKLFKNHGYAPDGTITDGVGAGQGAFLDAGGNLYVADSLNVAVREFAPGTTTFSFSYTAGMVDPSNVAVDRKGDVFEADWADNGIGFVNEYPKNVNAMLHHCSLGGPAIGLAVDSASDVFANYRILGKTVIVEFKGGLSGCHATKLGIRFRSAGGMAVDRNGNLIVCDLVKPAVDVLAPPYNAVTRVLGSGYVEPYAVAIDRKNTKVFVADSAGGNENAIDVIEYSSGTVLDRLGRKQGLFDPVGVTDGPNAVY